MLNAWRMAHIVAGTVALATFWIPLVTFKGGRPHRTASLVYAWSMLVLRGRMCRRELQDSKQFPTP
jgi:hypothetical protein